MNIHKTTLQLAAMSAIGLFSMVSVVARPVGIDSDFNCCSVDWPTVATNGIQFACVKATEWTDWTNSVFANRLQGAQAAGIYTIPYHRCNPSLDTPKAEADYFWNWAGSAIYGSGYNLSPALDVEDGLTGTYKKDGGGTQNLAAWCNQWYSDVESDAAAVGIQFQQLTYVNVGITCDIGSGLNGHLWLADPCGCNAQTGSPYTCGGCSVSDGWDGCEPIGSESWSLWQYEWSSQESTPPFPGLSERVDINSYNGTLANMVSTLGAVVTSDRIDCFVRTANATPSVAQKYYTTSGGWVGWPQVGTAGNVVGKTAACSFCPGRLDLFCRGTNNALEHITYTLSGGWNSWASIGGDMTSDPCAVSWGDGRIDVFYLNTNNQVVQRYWTSSGGWNSGEVAIGGGGTPYPGSAPAVCSWALGRLDIFVRGSTNDLQHISYDSSGWSGWGSLGGVLTSAPGATSLGLNNINVFAQDGQNPPHVEQIYWNGSSWIGWVDMGANGTGAPAACSWGSGRLDLFVRGSANDLQHKWWNSNGWSGWESLGGALTADPGCVSWTSGN